MRNILLAAVFMSSLTHTGVLLAADTNLVEFLNSGRVLTANLPFSEAVRVGNTLYLSGQFGIVPGSM